MTIYCGLAVRDGAVYGFSPSLGFSAGGANNPPVLNNATLNIYADTSINTAIATLLATDPDLDAITYSILSGNVGSAFTLGTSTGILRTTIALSVSVYSLVIQAQDSNGATDTATITINVLAVPNANGKPLVTDAAFSISESAAIDAIVGTIIATDPDDDAITFELVFGSADFAINTTTGQITVARPLSYNTRKSYELVVAVTDSNGGASGGNIFITVLPATITYPTVQSLLASIEFYPGKYRSEINILHPSNTHVVEVTDLLYGLSRQLVDNATIQLVIQDEDGANLTGVTWPISLTLAQPGHYWAGIGSNMNLDGLTGAVALITATTPSGSNAFWRKELSVSDRVN